jgi:hypothetical protein
MVSRKVGVESWRFFMFMAYFHGNRVSRKTGVESICKLTKKNL